MKNNLEELIAQSNKIMENAKVILELEAYRQKLVVEKIQNLDFQLLKKGLKAIKAGEIVSVDYRFKNAVGYDYKINATKEELDDATLVLSLNLEGSGIKGLPGFLNSKKSDRLNAKADKLMQKFVNTTGLKCHINAYSLEDELGEGEFVNPTIEVYYK